jgi:hypothetical protein
MWIEAATLSPRRWRDRWIVSETQIGRALEQLGIELMAAYSPGPRALRAAVGTWAGTVGGRTPLPPDHHPEAANRFLASRWLSIHNHKFTVAAQQSGTAFVLPGHGTDKIFSIQHERVVATITPCGLRT